MKAMELSTSATSNHRMFIVGTNPTQNFPYHHPWLLGWGPMQYGRIPPRTCDRNWQGLRRSEAQWVWLGLASHEWLRYWLDPHVPHVYQWCSLGNGPCPRRRIIFASWCIACAAAGCAEPVEYAISVWPKSLCKWEIHPDTPLQMYF